MRLYLSSFDSTNIHRDNNAVDFIVELPAAIALEKDRWKVALVDFSFIGTRKRRAEEDLYVYSDIAEHETFVSDAYRPLLDIVDSSGQLLHPHFVTVAEDYLHRIRIYIRAYNYTKPTITARGVRCTLQLEQQ